MTEDGYWERLRAAMGITARMPDDEQRRRVKALADGLCISYQAVMKYSSGTSKAFTAANNARAARVLQVDPDWLALGDGEMRTGRVWPFGLEVSPADWHRCPEDTKRAAIDLVRAAVDRMQSKPRIAHA
jgi:hypothetical protein